MLLRRLVRELDCTLVQGRWDVDVRDIYYDSRRVTTGGLFVCIVGTKLDSHGLAAAAVQAGAAVLVIEHDLAELPPPAVTVLRVENSRKALALLSAAWFGYPGRALELVGVTGTKGKTSTTHMIGAILSAAGHRVGLLGTNGASWPGHHHPLTHTTMESYELQKLLRQLVDAGCDTCVMEVSSQGLMMDRVAGLWYTVGVFTNLSPDHIGPGEHTSFEDYRYWKGRLFHQCGVGVLNADDANTPALLQGAACEAVYYGIDAPDTDYGVQGTPRLLRTAAMLGVAFTARLPGGGAMDLEVGMPGRFSVYNALAATAAARALGADAAAIQSGLRDVVVKGRVELVPVSARFTVLLDYAHNEAAAENLLVTLRAYRPKRLVAVFGCGGDRSRLRRTGMGEVCARLADFLILTEDNNRYEAVEDILNDIKAGIARVPCAAPFVEVPDRLDALHYALDHAEDGDIIAVMGKGHETYRDRKGVKTPFLERELLEEYAAARGIQ